MPKQMVNWDAAAGLVEKYAPPGPKLSRAEAADVVGGLREAGLAAVEPILATTEMRPAPGLPQDSFGEIYVVDRAGWAATNLTMMKNLTERSFAKVADRLPINPVSPYATAAEVAGMMAVLAPRVLGQFDPYSVIETAGFAPLVSTGSTAGAAPLVSTSSTAGANNPSSCGDAAQAAASAGSPRGQLLLIAPNVAQIERELKVDPKDFRLWVALHEQTHGLQFAAAPWLAPHLYGLIGNLLEAMTDKTMEATQGNSWEKLLNLLKLARDVFNSMIHTEGNGPIEALLGPEHQLAFGTISATMALLEGHADVMMDEVGPAVVPTVSEIREKFEDRRDGVGQNKAGMMLRRLMGMDAKLAQYRDGAVFVRGVEAQVGREGFNAIWAGPENLPTPEEIIQPGLWVRRVHG